DPRRAPPPGGGRGGPAPAAGPRAAARAAARGRRASRRGGADPAGAQPASAHPEGERADRRAASRLRRPRAHLQPEAETDGQPEGVAGTDGAALAAAAQRLQGASGADAVTSRVLVGLRVRATPARAFEVFVRDIGAWWQPND